MPAATPPTLRKCPACDAPLLPGRAACSKCQMPVAKMADFLKAKQSALLRGLDDTRITRENARSEMLRAWLRPGLKIAVVIAIVVGGYLAFHHLFGNRVPAWQTYPTDPQALVTNAMNLIDADDMKSHDQVYHLMSMSVHHPDDSDEHGFYMQTFHEVHKYLAGEFGTDWLKGMTVEQEDPKETGGAIVYLVKVGPETLHFDLEAQVPKDGPAPNPPHYGIIDIREFPIEEAAKEQQMGAIGSVVGGMGGGAASNNLQTVIIGLGAQRRTTMQIKREVLPRAHVPSVTRMEILHLWPARKDPVVRARLEGLTQDMRFAPDVQKTAQQILDGTVPDEDLIAGHVPDQ